MTSNNYPEWAPSTLIETHKAESDGSCGPNSFDPESIIADAKAQFGGQMSEEAVESLRQQLYRNVLASLPGRERTELLGRLLTDLRMKSVWKALEKRVANERDYHAFVNACEHFITAWRGDNKRTAAERRAMFQEVAAAAANLQSLLCLCSEFDDYSIKKLIDEEKIQWFIDVLPARNTDDAWYASACLSEIIPSVQDVLQDIAQRATEYGEMEPVVKKPNSSNAQIHYFVRCLSNYCVRRYQQPLHEVVAITTAVVFGTQDLDSDYVRKIVKP